MADEASTEGTTTVEETPNPFAETPEDDSVDLLGQDEEGASEEEAQPSKVGDQPKSKAPGQSTDPVEQLINEKYAGDRGKFVEGLHNQWNSSAQLAAEIKELKALLTAKGGKSEPVEEETFKDDPDFALLNDQRALVTQEMENLVEIANSTKASFAETNNALIREKVLEERADDFDKKEHSREIRRLEGIMQDLNKTWKQLPAEEKRIQLQLKNIDNQLESAKRNAQSRSQAQKQKLEANEREQGKFRGEVTSLTEQAIKESGLQSGSASAKRMYSYIWWGVRDVLESLPDNAAPIDPVLAVKHFADEFMEGLTENQKQSFRAASTLKQQGKPVVTPQSQRTVLSGAKTVRAGELTKDKIEAHHRKVFNLG